MNTLKAKVAVATIAMGLAAGGALAAVSGYPVDVTLPQAVDVGNRILPSGQYEIDQMPVGGRESMFVFRDENGNTAAVVEGAKMVQPTDVDPGGASRKTELRLSPGEDGMLHLNELFIEGESIGYRFIR
jgi:hypothetical protein